MKTSFNINSPNIKALAIPLGVLLGLILVSVFAVRLGFSKINEQRAEIDKNKQVENILKDKERILDDLSGEIDKFTNAISIALPDRYSGFVLIAQIKLLAMERSLIISELKGGSETISGDLSSVNINFTVEGPLLPLLEYLKDFKQVSPISRIEKAKFSQSAGLVKADISIRSYFAPFPTQLPAITEPMKDLTALERDTLSKIILFRQPLQNSLTPQLPGLRDDPFN
jgi:hypothetical protein